MTKQNLEFLARSILLEMVQGRTIPLEFAEITAQCAWKLAEAFSAEQEKRQPKES